jgi:hypothetical protein
VAERAADEALSGGESGSFGEAAGDFTGRGPMRAGPACPQHREDESRQERITATHGVDNLF